MGVTYSWKSVLRLKCVHYSWGCRPGPKSELWRHENVAKNEKLTAFFSVRSDAELSARFYKHVLEKTDKNEENHIQTSITLSYNKVFYSLLFGITY